MSPKLFGSKWEELGAGDPDRDWIETVYKVGAKHLISYLRQIPKPGLEYLLVLDGSVRGRYNMSTDLNAMQVLTGNYVVYGINVRDRPLRGEFVGISMADPGVVVTVQYDLILHIDDVVRLFTSTTGKIETEVERRIKREIRNICVDHLPADFVIAQHKIQNKLLGMEFDFGVSIEDALIEIVLPEDGIPSSQHKEREIDQFVSDTVEFKMDVIFPRQDFPHEVEVGIGVVIDDRDPHARDKLKVYSMVDRNTQIEKRAQAEIRNVLRQNTSSIRDAEEQANQAVKHMEIPFGVRVDWVNVQVLESEDERTERQLVRFEDTLHELLREGLQALFTYMAARPVFKQQVQGLLENLRDQQAYDDQRTAQLEDRQLKRLEESIKIGVLDPEVLDDDAQESLRRYLLSGNQLSVPALTGGSSDQSRSQTKGASDDEVIDRPPGDQQNVMDNVTHSKPEAPSEWTDDPDDE